MQLWYLAGSSPHQLFGYDAPVSAVFELPHQGRKRLVARWNSLLDALGIDSGQYFRILDDLLTRYSEPQRAYHTLAHLAMLFELLPQGHPEQAALEFAVWFHDAVYDPTRLDNEEASAALAHNRLVQMGLPEPLIQRVEELILATKSHQATDQTAALFLEADLSILGSDEKTYERYARAIRQEYAWLPEEVYRAGRAKVLEGFLLRERIYQTERWGPLETPARANLGRELQALKSPLPQ